MTRYIPPNDAEFLAWMNNFLSVLNANLATAKKRALQQG